ncbi:MAG: S8 family serine peptidase, partial [Acidimicrobiales bacterium]
LTPATSAAFGITPAAATQLAFNVQPGTTTAGATITPAIQVTARDALGNTVTAFVGPVTVAITAGTGTPGAVLSGTRTVGAVEGSATFSTLSINRSGTNYTLTATASGLPGAISAPFTITAGTATQLVFTAQPVTTTAGVTLPPVQVAVRDSLGNPVPGFTDAVTLTMGTGGTLAGTTTVAAVAGVATFSTLRIHRSGTGHRLVATAGSLTRTSGAFSIMPAAATQLSFSVQPVTATAGATITPAVRVAGLDAFGNTATSFTGTVTIAIGTNPAGGVLAGTQAIAASAGVAVFSTLRIDKAGSGYTLAATSPGLTATTSAAFDIVPIAATQATSLPKN